MSNIPTLSTGHSSTVGNWIMLSEKLFGKESKQVKFLQTKISEERGLDEPILANENQLLHVLVNLGSEE